jgi:hypothetical protein
MLSLLPRYFGLALLVVSLATSPVLGSMSRCCKTGAVAGGGNCCCETERHASATANRESEAPKSCCAAEACPSEPAPAIESRCCCQAGDRMPAVAASEADRSASRFQKLMTAVLPQACENPSHAAAEWLRVAASAESPPASLQKIYCRWTV